MRSNGGRGLVLEVISPAAGESRRVGDSAALARRRSCAGGTDLIAGGCGEESRTVSIMSFSALGRWFATVRAWLLAPRTHARSLEAAARVGRRRVIIAVD